MKTILSIDGGGIRGQIDGGVFINSLSVPANAEANKLLPEYRVLCCPRKPCACYSFSGNNFEKTRGRRPFWRISPIDNALKIIICKTITVGDTRHSRTSCPLHASTPAKHPHTCFFPDYSSLIRLVRYFRNLIPLYVYSKSILIYSQRAQSNILNAITHQIRIAPKRNLWPCRV